MQSVGRAGKGTEGEVGRDAGSKRGEEGLTCPSEPPWCRLREAFKAECALPRMLALGFPSLMLGV